MKSRKNKISHRRFIKNLFDQNICREKAIELVEDALTDKILYKKPSNKKSNIKSAKRMVRLYFYLFRRDKKIEQLKNEEITIKRLNTKNNDVITKEISLVKKSFWDL